MRPAQRCPSCDTVMQLERLRCPACQTVVEGSFRWPRLSRLTPANQELIELLILASGSLKDVAKKMDISYPTIRKRLDELIQRMEVEVKADEAYRKQLLRDVASGKRSAEEATRLMRPNHGASHERT